MKHKYNLYPLQLMVVGVNGLTGVAAVLPVDLVKRQDRDFVLIPDLSIEGIIVLERARSIIHVKLLAAQVKIARFSFVLR